MKVAKHKELYMKHRRHAKARGIPFLLSYEEWLKIWMDSGHWHDRGVNNKRNHHWLSLQLG